MEDIIKNVSDDQLGEKDLPGGGFPSEKDSSSDMPDDDQFGEESMESLMDMYEESFKRFAEGEVVNGKIIAVDKDYVLVDIGYKSEGQIRIHEFRDEDGNINANIDDVVEVMVEFWDEEEERVALSKEKAAKVKVWEAIKETYGADGRI